MAQNKRQTTAAKRAREQAVREKRARKDEKKAERRLAIEEGRVLEDGTIVPRAEEDELASSAEPD